MIEKAYDRAKDILASNREKLEALAQSLLDNEVIFKEDVERILGARPFASAAPAASNSEAQTETAPAEDASEKSGEANAATTEGQAAESTDDAPEDPKAES